MTLLLLKLNAVLGVQGSFNSDGSLKTVGLTCAVCHSTVDDSLAAGVGRRLDGFANHDLNPGAIIAAAPNVAPITDLLRVVNPTITDAQVRDVLNSWGPGKFDAELPFDGKANCNSCHREPLWTEPGWNDHSPAEMKIDSFQANRSPDGRYKTMNLAGVFVRERALFMKPENKGRFYHDGRFATLKDVVKSYVDRGLSPSLTDQEVSDLVEYLKSL